MNRLRFEANGQPIECDVDDGESLLSVLRERLGLTTVKDGCAPQGQCGCCTVLVDGAPRVACVTPASRVEGRSITTLEGLDTDRRDAITEALAATGGTQCGFCTPGIVMRCAALAAADDRPDRARVDRALAAHLCRCTGWQTIVEAIVERPVSRARDLSAARQRAELEGGVPQQVGPHVASGGVQFADDSAPAGALVAVPLPAGSAAEAASDVDVVDAAGLRFVVAESVHAARPAPATSTT